jgi:predicted porin
LYASCNEGSFDELKLLTCVKGNIMTKKLLPTVIGMILAGGVGMAQADVQLMGHLDESINYINGGKYDGPNDPDLNNTNFSPYVARGDTNTQLVCTTCSVGVKGSEDLGNGLKAMFFLDWQYDINGWVWAAASVR